ncbi:MAG TPA: BrnT family toxin [Xenococcaceae cyanobacterium]|jgi:uncharacterized DUF497 family protein
MRYQWDRNKALTNLNKHGINFADAVSVFSDELAITIFERTISPHSATSPRQVVVRAQAK